MQALAEIIGAGEIIGGHIVAGEGIGHGAQGCELGGNIPSVRHIEELVLQIMGNTGGNLMLLSLKGKLCMDGAEIRHKIGQTLGKALPGYHHKGQTIGKGFPTDRFIQLGVYKAFHQFTPLRK